MGTVKTEVGEEASKGKDFPFSVSNVLEKYNKTAVEQEGKVEAESGTEETKVVQNTKDSPIIEVVNKPPTLPDPVIYGKSSIGSGRNANISVIESPVIKIRGHLTINSMVLRQRISIEVDQEGDEEEGA